MPTRFLLAAMLALAPGFGWATAALAQSEIPQQQAPGPSFSEQELKSFAVASLEVEQIVKKYEEKLLEVETPEQEKEISEQANSEMAAAVEQKGLTVDKYNAMVVTVTSDPNLTRQVFDYRKEAQ